MTTRAHSRRRIFLMRHGSVTYFDDTGKPFLPESVALNEQGRAQASAAGQAFAAHQVQFDRVIVSGLPRTVETAHRVLAETGQHIAIDSWPELEEIRGGRLSAIADTDLRDAFTGAFEGMVSADQRFSAAIGRRTDDRIHPAIARLLTRTGHGAAGAPRGVNCAILSLALTGQRLFLGALAQTAGCINALDVGDDATDWVVRFVNYAPPAPLHGGPRDTTMEALFAQYKKSRK
jgi:probable phosphoglycerate mutase